MTMPVLKIEPHQFMQHGVQTLVRNGGLVCIRCDGDQADNAEVDSTIMPPTEAERGRKTTLLLVVAILAALLSGAAVAFIGKTARAEQPQPKFSLEDHKAAIDSFYVASSVLKERCRAMADTPAACLAKGEEAMLERVRKVCEDAKGSKELCGEIADAKRY